MSANTDTGTLNAAQIAVLIWVAEGSRVGVMEGYGYRISAVALRSRGLVRITGRGKSWRAEITPTGREFLEGREAPRLATGPKRRGGQGPDGDGPTTAACAPTSTEHSAAETTALVRPPRPLSKTEQLVADVIANGGVLRVPAYGSPGETDYGRLVASAQRFGKVPAGKRLLTRYAAGELEIRMEDALDGTHIAVRPVPVPKRISRLHPVASHFRDETDHHEVSRASLGRCVRIVQGLSAEAELRGYEIADVAAVKNEYGRATWSGRNDGHLTVAIRGHRYSLRIFEEKVVARGGREREIGLRAGTPHGQLYRPGPVRAYDADATGRLTIALDGGYGREGRAASWGDRRSWTLEEKLPDVFRELEVRAAEDDHRELEVKREAEERRRRWEASMEQAKRHFVEAHRAAELRAQVARWKEAGAIRGYLAAIEEAHGHDGAAAEWIAWVRGFVERLDPLLSQIGMPETPAPSPEDLKPFLGALSPYGPSRW